MLSRIICLAILVLIGSISAEKVRYDNYRLVNLKFDTEEQFQLIGELDNLKDFDLWGIDKMNSKTGLVLLSPEALKKYTNIFNEHKIGFEIVHENIQEEFDAEERELWANVKAPRANIIHKFATYAEYLDYIEDIVLDNPTIASSYDAARTYNNRVLKVLVLKTATSKKSIWLDCGIHAREWVSPPTCIYTIDQIVKDHKKNPANSILNEYEFHVLPLVNPDGYEYTRTTDRMWRKNLRNNIATGGKCNGVDLNRNFDFYWMSVGASDDTCSDIYAGPKAASEPETVGISAAIQAKKDWVAYFSIHSYGQYCLISYGHNKVPPADYADMEYVAKQSVAAIANATPDKTKFTAGQSSVVLYETSGSSQDWAKAKAGIKYAYTYELRPQQYTADGFIYGFKLPEDRLPKVTLETYSGLMKAIEAIKERENN